MRKTTSKLVAQEVVVSVTCNQCGKRTKPSTYYANVKYSAGYASDPSTGIKDGDEFEFDLCEKCLANMMRGFKIQPTYHNFIYYVKGEKWAGAKKHR